MDPSSARPWQFDLPTLAEMQQEDWVDKVMDWELFWTRHMVWQKFIQYRARKNAKPRREHEEWWGLHDIGEVQKVACYKICMKAPCCRLQRGIHMPSMRITCRPYCSLRHVQALNAVADRLEDLLELGVPVPEHVPFDNFGNVHVDRRVFDIYGRKKLAHFALDKQVSALPLSGACAGEQELRFSNNRKQA